YAAVLPDHDLPARGKSHPINFWYGARRNFCDGSRRLRWNSFFWTAVLANAAACSSVCLLSFGRAIHSRMIFRRVSWSFMFAVPFQKCCPAGAEPAGGEYHENRTAPGEGFNRSKCNSPQTQPRISDRARGGAAYRGRQAEPLRAPG